MSVLVTCTKKEYRGTNPNKYMVVTGIGGVGTTTSSTDRWYFSEADAIAHIENGTYSFYTSINGVTANVVVTVIDGKKELTTKGDSTTGNNLLRLQDCP